MCYECLLLLFINTHVKQPQRLSDCRAFKHTGLGTPARSDGSCGATSSFLVNDRPSRDRLHNLDVFDFFLFDRVRIICQYDEVG